MPEIEIIEVLVPGAQGPAGAKGETADVPTVVSGQAALLSAAQPAVSLLGYASAGDGGRALYKRVAAQPAHAGRFRSADRFLPDGQTSTANGGWWEIAETTLTFEMFNAKGDGQALDTAALQAGLNVSAALGRQIVGRPGARYKVHYTGSKSVVNAAGGLSSYPFCVDVPTGAIVDFRNAVITADDINAILLCNRVMSSVGDVVDVRNLKLDGGTTGGSVRSQPLAMFYGCTGKSQFRNIRAEKTYYMGLYWAGCVDCDFDELDAADIKGQAVQLGGNTAHQLSRCRIGRGFAENVASYGTFNQPGNGFFLGVADTSIGQLRQRNCAGGIKWGPNSARSHADYLETDGTVLDGETNHASQNSGVKFQGEDDASKVVSVSVGTIRSTLQGGAGLYTRFATDIRIGQYIGKQNGQLGLDPDLDIYPSSAYDRVIINTAQSRSAGFGAAQHNGNGRTEIVHLTIDDAASVTEANAYGWRALGGSWHIGDLVVMDSRTPAKSLVAIQATSSNQEGVVSNYRTNYNSRFDLRSPDVTVFNARLFTSSNNLTGFVTLSAGTSVTIVSNANIVSQSNQSGYVEPIILLTPFNESARQLGVPRYYVSGSFILGLAHAAAAGGEVYEYQIVGYRFYATKRPA